MPYQLTQVHAVGYNARTMSADDSQTLTLNSGSRLQAGSFGVQVQDLGFLPMHFLENTAASLTKALGLLCTLDVERFERHLGKRHLAVVYVH